MQKKSSSLPYDSDGSGSGLSTALTIINKVYDIHRRSHYYSIRKSNPKIYRMNLAEVEKYDILVLEKAFEIYKDARNHDDSKRPHPNYFVAICRGIIKETIDEPKLQWGKTI